MAPHGLTGGIEMLPEAETVELALALLGDIGSLEGEIKRGLLGAKELGEKYCMVVRRLVRSINGSELDEEGRAFLAEVCSFCTSITRVGGSSCTPSANLNSVMAIVTGLLVLGNRVSLSHIGSITSSVTNIVTVVASLVGVATGVAAQVLGRCAVYSLLSRLFRATKGKTVCRGLPSECNHLCAG